jgi:hypothetical protein
VASYFCIKKIETSDAPRAQRGASRRLNLIFHSVPIHPRQKGGAFSAHTGKLPHQLISRFYGNILRYHVGYLPVKQARQNSSDGRGMALSIPSMLK